MNHNHKEHSKLSIFLTRLFFCFCSFCLFLLFLIGLMAVFTPEDLLGSANEPIKDEDWIESVILFVSFIPAYFSIVWFEKKL